MICAAGYVPKEVELKEEVEVLEVVDVAEPDTWPDLDTHVVEEMKKVQEAMYPICVSYILDYLELVYEHELLHVELSLDFVNLLLSDLPYNARSGRKNVNSHYDVTTLEVVVDTVALCKWVMRPGAHVLRFCPALQFSQWYKILSRPGKEKDSDSARGGGIVTKAGEEKKKKVFVVDGVSLYYSREVRNIKSSNFTPDAHHVRVVE